MDEENLDIRWKQRFAHYKKAFALLEQTMTIEAPSDAERAGLIHFFEMSFELAWKVLKDYLEEEGFNTVASPRQAVKQAFQAGLISDGHIWMEALMDRNLAVHTYEEKIAVAVEKKIRNSYFPVLAELLRNFSAKVDQ
jgi:nucleotidyltransferase substrate binding protein (TIGR01987 family)